MIKILLTDLLQEKNTIYSSKNQAYKPYERDGLVDREVQDRTDGAGRYKLVKRARFHRHTCPRFVA